MTALSKCGVTEECVKHYMDNNQVVLNISFVVYVAVLSRSGLTMYKADGRLMDRNRNWCCDGIVNKKGYPKQLQRNMSHSPYGHYNNHTDCLWVECGHSPSQLDKQSRQAWDNVFRTRRHKTEGD
jgi:hypothetical protein